MEHTDTLAALSDGMADAVENVAASVVRVNGRRRRSGSGVVFAQNKVLTSSLRRARKVKPGSARSRWPWAATLAARDRGPPLAWLAPSEVRYAPGGDRGWNVTSRPT